MLLKQSELLSSGSKFQSSIKQLTLLVHGLFHYMTAVVVLLVVVVVLLVVVVVEVVAVVAVVVVVVGGGGGTAGGGGGGGIFLKRWGCHFISRVEHAYAAAAAAVLIVAQYSVKPLSDVVVKSTCAAAGWIANRA